MKRVFLAFLFAVVGLLASRTAEASHFRFGTINWKIPDPQNAPLTVQFTVQHGWRASAPDFTDLNFGDGVFNGAVQGPLIGTGTDASGQAYNLYEYTVTHTYAAAGQYTAFFQSCCRIAGLVNGDQADFRVESIVSLEPGNTGGPVSLAPAIVQMQLGGIRQYTLASFDPDLDLVSCRFATAAETGLPAGSEIPAVPNGGAKPTLSGACTITWDLTNAVVNQKYVVHIVMESAHNGGALSTTAVDLLVEIVNTAPPVCMGSGTFVANVGMPFTTPVIGTDPGLGTLKLSAQNAPMGSTLTPPSGTTGPSPFPATFSWTPTAADVGTTIVLVNYTSAQNITGTCSLTIQVPQCQGFGSACQAPGAQGECVNGTTVCAGPGQSTCAAGNPAPETCDLKDNDCDGTVDNATIESGLPCSSGAEGVCGPGTSACSMGMVSCVSNIMPGSQMETCNDQDDDCDGAVDEDYQVGQMCTAGVGECAAPGLFLCAADGSQNCNAVPLEPTPEVCDAKDNDCDGVVDNNPAGVGVVCMTGLPGVCATGMTTCSAAGMVDCTPDVQPGTTMETCNDLDDDCDGSSDEDFPTVDMTCTVGTGVCQATGTFVCGPNGGAPVCDAQPGMPMTETCDDGGVDNDCDGNPNNGVDCDDDKIPDDVEIAIGTDPNDKDSDDDGVIDGEEIPKGSTTFDLDSDDDGKINALDPDSDNDGLKDGTELGLGCNDPATNLEAGNCTPDGDGGATTTNPLDPDTDKGGVNDGDEDTDKDGVVDEGERDPNVPGDDKATTPQCTQDSDCGGPTSGKVCNAENTCQDGCRGTGGNGCPATQECSSKDDTIGTCSDVEQPGTIIFGEGSGLCAVQQPGNDNGSASAAWLLGLVALARVVARRRKAG
jgi:hypothetical protein